MNIPISYWSKPVSFCCDAHNEILTGDLRCQDPKRTKSTIQQTLLVIKTSQPCTVSKKDSHGEVTIDRSLSQDRNGGPVKQSFVSVMNIFCACIYPNTHTHTQKLPRGQGLRCSPSRHKAGPSFQISLTRSSVHFQKPAWRVLLRSIKIWVVLYSQSGRVGVL